MDVLKRGELVDWFNSFFSFDLTVRDPESGVAYVLWTFRRSNGVILYQEKIPGKRAAPQVLNCQERVDQRTDCGDNDFLKCNEHTKDIWTSSKNLEIPSSPIFTL